MQVPVLMNCTNEKQLVVGVCGQQCKPKHHVKVTSWGMEQKWSPSYPSRKLLPKIALLEGQRLETWVLRNP
jgi:hypothetical protein